MVFGFSNFLAGMFIFGLFLCHFFGFKSQYADIEKLLQVLHRLVDQGNTVAVIEHNLDVIKAADWIIDLGPEGGDGGGWVIAEGTPEEVSRVKKSYTGQFLKGILVDG